MFFPQEGPTVKTGEGRSFDVRADFVLLPTGVWLNRSIPLGAKALYQGLLWCAFEDGCKPDDSGGFRCRPDNARLEAFCSCSANSLTRHFAALDRLGLIRRDVSRGGPRAVVELLVGPKGEVLAAGTEGEELTKMVGCPRTNSPKLGVELTKMVGSTHQNRESNSPKLGVPPIRESSELPESKTKPPQPPDGGRSGGGDSSSTPGKAEDRGTEAEAVGREAIAQAKALKADPDCAKRIGLKARRAVEAGDAVALVQRTAAAVARQVAKGGGPGLVEKAWRDTIEAEKLAGDDVPPAPAPPAAQGLVPWHLMPAEERLEYDRAARRTMQLLRNRKEVIEGATHADAAEFMAKSGWKYNEFKFSGRLYRFIEKTEPYFFHRLEGEFHDTARRAYLDLARASWGGETDVDWMWDQAREVIKYICDDPSDGAARKTFDYGRIATECREEPLSQWSPEGYRLAKEMQAAAKAAKPAPGPYDEEEDERNPIPANPIWDVTPSVAPQPPAPPPQPPAPMDHLERTKANAERLAHSRRFGGVHIADVLPTMVTQAATA